MKKKKLNKKWLWYGWDGYDEHGILCSFYRQNTPIKTVKGKIHGLWKVPWYIKYNPFWIYSQWKLKKDWGKPYFLDRL